jgi:hypothetical protein
VFFARICSCRWHPCRNFHSVPHDALIDCTGTYSAANATTSSDCRHFTIPFVSPFQLTTTLDTSLDPMLFNMTVPHGVVSMSVFVLGGGAAGATGTGGGYQKWGGGGGGGAAFRTLSVTQGVPVTLNMRFSPSFARDPATNAYIGQENGADTVITIGSVAITGGGGSSPGFGDYPKICGSCSCSKPPTNPNSPLYPLFVGGAGGMGSGGDYNFAGGDGATLPELLPSCSTTFPYVNAGRGEGMSTTVFGRIGSSGGGGAAQFIGNCGNNVGDNMYVQPSRASSTKLIHYCVDSVWDCVSVCLCLWFDACYLGQNVPLARFSFIPTPPPPPRCSLSSSSSSSFSHTLCLSLSLSHTHSFSLFRPLPVAYVVSLLSCESLPSSVALPASHLLQPMAEVAVHVALLRLTYSQTRRTVLVAEAAVTHTLVGVGKASPDSNTRPTFALRAVPLPTASIWIMAAFPHALFATKVSINPRSDSLFVLCLRWDPTCRKRAVPLIPRVTEEIIAQRKVCLLHTRARWVAFCQQLEPPILQHANCASLVPQCHRDVSNCCALMPRSHCYHLLGVPFFLQALTLPTPAQLLVRYQLMCVLLSAHVFRTQTQSPCAMLFL